MWRYIAAGGVVVLTTKAGRHPSPATVMRMLRDHGTSIAELDAGADDASNGRSPWPVPEPRTVLGHDLTPC
jgi:hypothetical protein